jgi:hypothetical protein
MILLTEFENTCIKLISVKKFDIWNWEEMPQKSSTMKTEKTLWRVPLRHIVTSMAYLDYVNHVILIYKIF